MKVFIFTGPTLRAEEGRRELEAHFLPPVAQGEVYRASLERPHAIGIIDGYFEQAPAVTHKEILWAMSQGIHVFGSASMGALRAAELSAFGMEGVGRIYRDFQRGALEDDDEVAVMHASSEDGYRALSEAMVNVRATLRRARAEGVLDAATRSGLERIAKELFYADRAWPVILAAAARQGLPERRLEALRAWLPGGRVDQKREDALELLRTLRKRLAGKPAPKQVRYTFEPTDSWEELRSGAAHLPLGADGGDASLRAALLEELRLEPRHAEAQGAALARALALAETSRRGVRHTGDKLQETEAALRQELGLEEPERFQRWLEENGVEDLPRLLRDEADLRWVRAMYSQALRRSLPDHLRVTGRYTALVDRARDKARVLRELGLEEPSLETAGVTERELWRWYFGERLGRPEPGDLERHALTEGFKDVHELERAALRELLYTRGPRLAVAGD